VRSLLHPADRQRLLERFERLSPGTPARWGRLDAPRMLTHLTDQMRHTLGDAHAAPHPGPLRLPGLKHLIMYWAPWPKGRVKGPPEAFLTAPTTWEADLATLRNLVGRFVADERRGAWPEHAIFGAMSRRSWGWFIHRHFDHHLRQFGA
jgi:hypothetical protein